MASKLTINTNFKVQESIVMEIIVGVIFFLLFFFSLTAVMVEFDWQKNFYNKSIWMTLIPAVLFTAKGIANKTSITINKNGIYVFNRFVTNWDNFIGAELTQKEIVGSIQDNFVLIVEYYKDNTDGYFRREIALTNTQNKSEEEVMEAIRFFSENCVTKN